MEATVRLYTLNYDEAKTYMWAAIFVACNLVLPQVFHLIPQGGIIFSPLSLVILVGAYKFGWKTGLLAALASPLVNHLLTGACHRGSARDDDETRCTRPCCGTGSPALQDHQSADSHWCHTCNKSHRSIR